MVGWLQWNLSQLNQFLSENRFAVPISTIENINYEKIYFYRKQEKKMTFFSGTANAPAVWGKQKSLTHILRSTFSGTFFRNLRKLVIFFVESWLAHVRRCTRSDGSRTNSYRKSYRVFIRTLRQLGSLKVEPSSRKIPTLPSESRVSNEETRGQLRERKKCRKMANFD